MPDSPTFGETLRTIREQRGMSQADLALASSMPTNAISHYENRRREPNLSSLKKLAGALRVSVAALVGEIKAEPPKIKYHYQAANNLNHIATLGREGWRLVQAELVEGSNPTRHEWYGILERIDG